MRVLGFDPGTASTGYGVVDQTGNRLSHVAHGVIRTSPGTHFAERLKILYAACNEVLRRFTPDAVALEKLYFSKNVTTGIAVAQARGVIALAAADYGRPIGEFSPTEVKRAITSNGHAPKNQVQQMIKILLNMDDIPKPDDAADALGIAICQLHTADYPSMEKKYGS